MEFRLLHGDAVAFLQRATENAMLTVQATTALRALFARAKLLYKQVVRRWVVSLDIHTQGVMDTAVGFQSFVKT
jgi:hypothetical protein